MAATSLSFVLPLRSPSLDHSYTTYIHLDQDDPCAIVKSGLAMYLYFVAALLLATAISQDIQLSDVPSCGQACLKNASDGIPSCSAGVHCLCTNTNYINTLACCLGTNCQPADQQKALSFNQQVCKSSNVTIPDSIGCSPPTSSTSSVSIAHASSNTGSSIDMSATLSSTSRLIGLTTATATGNYFVPAVTLPVSAPVAKFTGGLLLQGSCTIPQFASVTIDGGGILEYPWLGCSNLDPGCCPFDISVGGLLSVCPKDYYTTSGACCPSGWQIYTSAFAGETPCFTTPSLPLIPAPTTSNVVTNSSLNVKVISAQLFTLKYALEPGSSGLTTGAKAGIAGGIVAGSLIFAVLLFLFIRHHRAARARELAEARAATEAMNTDKKRFSALPAEPPEFTELPTPAPPMHELPSQNTIAFELPAMPTPAQEMPGDSYINAHHPAFNTRAESITEEPYSPITTIRDSVNEPTLSEATTARESVVEPEFVAPAAARKSQFIAGPLDRESVVEPLFTPPAEGELGRRSVMPSPLVTPGVVSPMTDQGGSRDAERASHFFAL